MESAALFAAMTTVEFQLGGTLRFRTEEQGHALMTLTHGAFTVTARGDDMAYKLATGMQVGVQVSYVDAKGNPAVVDGDVAWSSSDESIATVTVDTADSTKATVVGVGTVLGIAQVIATADADLGQGVRQIMTTADVEVVAGEAIAGTITVTGEAVPVPPAR
jgi:hypothetical protein